MDLLIFDLDGTLIDSKQDLADAVNATRAHLGLSALDDAEVQSYVGNGARKLIERSLEPGAPAGRIDAALSWFLDYYGEHCLEHTRAYPGVKEALDLLQDGGLRMAVLTNKPVRISRKILAALGLTHFAQVYGGDSLKSKKPDPAGVDALLNELRVERSRAMMVGDSSVDVRTARNAGIPVCGVTYGFQPESLAEDPPDLLVDRMEELADVILNSSQKGLISS